MSNKEIKILITEPKSYSPKAIKILKTVGKVFLLTKKEEFKKVLPKINILVIKLSLRINRQLIDAATNLKLIATSTTGLDHIAVDYAKGKRIEIISLRGETDFLKNIHSTGEHTIALILALLRKIPWAFDSIKKREWKRESFYGNEIYGKTIGILGYGRLGKMVAGYAKTFGLKVIAYDPNVEKKVLKSDNVLPVSFNDIFRKSDIISVHVSLSPETKNLIQEKRFRLMRKTAVFVNTSRGQIVNEKALLKALKNKWIAGAAIDVMADEKADGSHLRNNSLLNYAKSHQNLLITPHLGGASFEAMATTEEFIAQKIKSYFLKNNQNKNV